MIVVDENYLSQFSRRFPDREELYSVEPVEIPLTGYERLTNSLVFDAPADSDLAMAALYGYKDDNEAELWKFKNDEKLRETFVIPKDSSVGYKFPGLLQPSDIRAWFRNKHGLPEVTEAEHAWVMEQIFNYSPPSDPAATSSGS